MIAYGIVGIGGFAATWVRCLASLERQGVARLAAAVVRNRPKYAAEVARLEERGCKLYSSLEELLERGRGAIDIIGVPTGIPYHAPMTIQALRAGYPVLVEKPVAATIQEVRAMEEAERASGQWCAVGYQWIYSPTMRWLCERLAEGRLGAMREARAAIAWPRAAGYYARNPWAGQLRVEDHWVLDGPATNATAHYLTNLIYLAGVPSWEAARVTAVRAELYRSKPITSYDTSCIELHLAGGARLLHLVSHALAESSDPLTEIFCEKGRIRWEHTHDSAEIHYADGSVARYANPDPSTLHELPFAQVARVAAGLEPKPLCGLAEGGPHVLAINLAFESNKGVTVVPEQYCRTQLASDGTPLVRIRDMEEVLRRAFAEGRLFSEVGAPWARASSLVEAAGYERFPSAALEAALA